MWMLTTYISALHAIYAHVHTHIYTSIGILHILCMLYVITHIYTLYVSACVLRIFNKYTSCAIYIVQVTTYILYIDSYK